MLPSTKQRKGDFVERGRIGGEVYASAHPLCAQFFIGIFYWNFVIAYFFIALFFLLGIIFFIRGW